MPKSKFEKTIVLIVIFTKILKVFQFLQKALSFEILFFHRENNDPFSLNLYLTINKITKIEKQKNPIAKFRPVLSLIKHRIIIFLRALHIKMKFLKNFIFFSIIVAFPLGLTDPFGHDGLKYCILLYFCHHQF